MKDILDLRVYTESLEFSNLVWDICKKFDYLSQKTVGIQLVKSTDSILANIAESFGIKLNKKGTEIIILNAHKYTIKFFHKYDYEINDK